MTGRRPVCPGQWGVLGPTGEGPSVIQEWDARYSGAHWRCIPPLSPHVQASVDLGESDPELRCEAKAEVIRLPRSDSRGARCTGKGGPACPLLSDCYKCTGEGSARLAENSMSRGWHVRRHPGVRAHGGCPGTHTGTDWPPGGWALAPQPRCVVLSHKELTGSEIPCKHRRRSPFVLPATFLSISSCWFPTGMQWRINHHNDNNRDSR